MSWESTALYYRLVNEDVRDRLGGFHSARLVLASVDFADVEAMQVAGDWEAAGRLLAAEARGLEAAGAECVVLCTNTMHRVADAIEAAVDIPLLHLADVTADAVRAARTRPGRAARHPLHDGAAVLRRPPPLARHRRARAGGRRPDARARRHLRRAGARRGARRVAGGVRRRGAAAGRAGRRGSGPRLHGDRAADRSRATSSSRSSRPLRCTRVPRSTSPSAEPDRPGRATPSRRASWSSCRNIGGFPGGGR